MTKLTDIPERYLGEDGVPREREAHLQHLRELLTKHAFDEDYCRRLRGRIAQMPAPDEPGRAAGWAVKGSGVYPNDLVVVVCTCTCDRCGIRDVTGRRLSMGGGEYNVDLCRACMRSMAGG